MAEPDTRLTVGRIDLTGARAIESAEAYGLMLAFIFWMTGSLPTGVTAKQIVDLMTVCDNARKQSAENSGAR